MAKNRAKFRRLIMEKLLGYGPDKKLAPHVSTRNVPAPSRRSRRMLLLDQPKQIYIDGANSSAVEARRLVSQSRAQGLHDRPQPDRLRHRRPRPDLLREFRVRSLRTTMTDTATPRPRQVFRSAIDGARPGKAQETGVGHRQGSWPKTGPGRSSPHSRSRAPAGILTSAGLDAYGQQHLQRLPDGRRLARQASCAGAQKEQN